MINLLPPDIKQAYFYAHSNQRLLKWISALIIGLVGVGAIGTYGWVNLHQAISTNNQKVNSLQDNLTANHLVQTERQVQTITNDFSLVVKVLSQEVLFSKLLSQMAAALPTGTNLTNLTIANTSGGSGLDITAEAVNYTLATQVQVNLADPTNGIFSKADIVNITCNAQGTTNQTYPCTVILRAQFAAQNQFLFINQKATK